MSIKYLKKVQSKINAESKAKNIPDLITDWGGNAVDVEVVGHIEKDDLLVVMFKMNSKEGSRHAKNN